MSLGDAVGKAIRKYVQAKKAHGLKPILLGEVDIDAIEAVQSNGHGHAQKVVVKDEVNSNYKLKCPECGNGTLSFMEGCTKCVGCGYSKC
jgi:hypothetical protein